MELGQAALRRHLENWVHGSALADPLATSRHRIFIGGALLAGALALAGFPAFVAFNGAPDLGQAAALAILAAPLLLAVLVSRTGKLELAALLVAGLTVLLLAGLAISDRAGAPIVIAGLALAPVEAALAGSRRVTTLSALMALAAAFALIAFAPPPATANSDGLLGLAVLVYGSGVAAKMIALARDSRLALAGFTSGYRLLCDNADELVTRHGADGGVAFASPAAGRLCGARPAALLGPGLFDHVHLADRPAFLGALSAARHGAPSRLRLRLKRELDGGPTFFAAEMRCSLWRDPLTGQASVVAVTRDVSSDALREEELAGARAEAEAAGRAKRAFLAHASHELRTPLNAIIGFSDILRNEMLDRLAGESRRDYARLIHAAGEQLLAEVNELLDLASLESGPAPLGREPVDLPRLIDKCLDAIRPDAAAKNLSVIRNLGEEVGEIEADPKACRQILRNLLANAVKFSHSGARIVVDARREGGSLVISVRDFGIGMAPEELLRLRQRFNRADSAYDRRAEEFGLSLSVAARLAELQGGSLSLQSEPGAGTIATLVMPLSGGGESMPPMALGASGAAIAVMPKVARELKRA